MIPQQSNQQQPLISGVNQRLINDIEKAVVREYQAIQFYNRLAELAPTKEARQAILDIRQDVIRHYNSFNQLFAQLSGRMPNIAGAPLPVSYRDGIREAIQDEMDAITFYKNISSSTQIPGIQHRFTRAVEDVARHEQILRNLLAQ
ncbi:ferritin-like domain-containing protein [Pseudalkalibacillus caeni]|uniref:Ferritin-like domain-containing protein n=1 Tax=Exobacillus caeni TaxID=2574798 RepID=A0A5R9FE95_9BACL|nr:ferritin-like domain-containing protein [Pseudalkalibacillus caeni]TLS37935.1 ferritin-like domain-containing protein [Pseudalkalibacillus caeni]